MITSIYDEARKGRFLWPFCSILVHFSSEQTKDFISGGFYQFFSRFWLHTNTSENECISRGMCSCDRAWAARFTVAVRVGDLVFRFLGFHGLRRDGGEENCCFLWGLSMSSGVLLKRTKGDVTRSVFCLFQIEKRRKKLPNHKFQWSRKLSESETLWHKKINHL